MNMTRRNFLTFLTTSAAVAGCKSSMSTGNLPKTVNIGAPGNYTKDGVYGHYRNAGFFLVRDGDKLFALSSFCTHRKCKLSADVDSTFYCPCHGSTFDRNGHVTKSPARVDLPVYPIVSNERGELMVQLR
jgi:Rieske Fe-S protein